jgi:hypothetical protein
MPTHQCQTPLLLPFCSIFPHASALSFYSLFPSDTRIDFISVRDKCKEWFGYTIPTFQPLYTYIPLVSPLKKNDNMDGFNLGEDNQIKYIDIKNGKLRIEVRLGARGGRVYRGAHLFRCDYSEKKYFGFFLRTVQRLPKTRKIFG